MVVNAAQLATYSQAKQAILNSGYIQVWLTIAFLKGGIRFGHPSSKNLVATLLTLKDSLTPQDGIFCHFVASMISGLVTTIASMPVGVIFSSNIFFLF